MSSYATVEDARSAGAVGSEAEITEAITDASARVERYTSELFTPTELTLLLDVDGDGMARPRKRIQSVTSVTWYGAAAPIAASAYRVFSSNTTGSRDEIGLYGDLSWADATVLGAEPWNGGWAALGGPTPRVTVVGVFGWSAPPRDVVRATSLIAAAIRRDDASTDSGSSSGADTEGNVLPVVPPFVSDSDDSDELARVRHRTTGVVEADAMLAPYVREPVRFR